jgi:hypothetical protein
MVVLPMRDESNTGTGLVAAGVDPKTAQAILGHSAVRRTLEVYARAVPALARAVDAVGAEGLEPPTSAL